MARFVRGSKWWEIALVKTTISTKWGKTGGSMSMREKAYADVAAAKKEYDKQVAEKVKAGFETGGDTAAPAKTKAAKAAPKAVKAAPVKKAAGAKANKDLEKAIIADPNDPEPYLVYADYLNEQGDARGELIVLHHRNAAEAATRIKKLTADLKKAMTWPQPEKLKLEWQFGFIKSAEIRWESSAEEVPSKTDDEDGDGDGDGDGGEDFSKLCKAQLLAFLNNPSARFIQELALGPVPAWDYMEMDKLAAAINEVKLPCLRSLDFSERGFWDLSSTSAALPASSATPALRELVIHAGALDLPKDIHWPHLVSAAFRTGSLCKGDLKNIVNAKWPNLETLEIWFGEPRYNADCTVKGVAPILAATGLGKVKHLKLKNCAFADDIVKALPKSKILAQLETLDLSMGNLSDAGVAMMAANKDAFKHLAVLVVDENALTDASTPLLRGLAKKVKNGGRHEPDRAVPRTEENQYRHYVSAGE